MSATEYLNEFVDPLFQNLLKLESPFSIHVDDHAEVYYTKSFFAESE